VLVLLALFYVSTKTLICKDVVNRDSTIQSEVRRFCLREFEFPISHLDDQATLSRRLLFLLRPSRRCAILSGCRQSNIIHLNEVFIPSGAHTASRSLCASLHPSRRFSSTSGCLSVLDQFLISFQAPRKGRSINRLDDVVSRLDVFLLKARIVIQISPSRHQSTLVRMRVLLIWKLLIRLQPSGRLPLMVQMHALQIWKLGVEELPSGRSSPMVQTRKALYGNYLQWTCDRPDDVPSRPDAALKQERFPCEIFRKSCLTIVRPDGPCPPSRRCPGIFYLTLI